MLRLKNITLKTKTMKYVVTGSLGNISKPLAEKLIAAGHSVTVVSSNQERSEEIILMGAQAAIGSVEDVAFLTRTFTGADAVYTMVPPHYGATDWKKHIAGIGENYAGAIRTSRVKNVVNLSSIGAHMPDGCGPVSGLYHVEAALNLLEGVNIKHLRPGFFFNNLLSNISMIKSMGIMGGNFGNHATMIYTHTEDIAEAAFRELNDLSFRGKSIRYIVSDEKTTDEVASIIGKAIEKPELSWINFSDEDSIAGMVQAGFSEEVARNLTELGAAMRNGELTTDYLKNKPLEFGRTKLETFAKTFVKAYSQMQPAAKTNI